MTFKRQGQEFLAKTQHCTIAGLRQTRFKLVYGALNWRKLGIHIKRITLQSLSKKPMVIQILESGKVQNLKWSPQRWKLTITFKEPNNKWPHSTNIHSTPLRDTRSNPFAKFSENPNFKSKTSKLTPHQEEISLKRIPKLQRPRAPNAPKQI
jgi:hypothetical protein